MCSRITGRDLDEGMDAQRFGEVFCALLGVDATGSLRNVECRACGTPPTPCSTAHRQAISSLFESFRSSGSQTLTVRRLYQVLAVVRRVSPSWCIQRVPMLTLLLIFPQALSDDKRQGWLSASTVGLWYCDSSW